MRDRVSIIGIGGAVVAIIPAAALADEWPSTYQKCIVAFAVLGTILIYVLCFVAAFAAAISAGILASSLRPLGFRKTSEAVETAPIRCILLGVAASLVAALVLAAIKNVPILNAAWVAFWLFALWYGFIAVSMALGKWVLFAANSPKSDMPPWNVLAGGGLLCAASILPGLGWMVGGLALVAGLGGFIVAPFSSNRRFTAQAAQTPANSSPQTQDPISPRPHLAVPPDDSSR